MRPQKIRHGQQVNLSMNAELTYLVRKHAGDQPLVRFIRQCVEDKIEDLEYLDAVEQNALQIAKKVHNGVYGPSEDQAPDRSKQ